MSKASSGFLVCSLSLSLKLELLINHRRASQSAAEQRVEPLLLLLLLLLRACVCLPRGALTNIQTVTLHPVP